jgi:hypothetical protein
MATKIKIKPKEKQMIGLKANIVPCVGYGLLTDQQITEAASDQKGLTFEQLKTLDKQGYVILENVLSQKEIDECLSELWDLLEAVPHKPEFQVKRPKNLTGPLSTSEIKELDRNWIPHKNYGMVNEPPIWHTKTHWKLRQDPYLYHVFTQIFGTEKLWCTIDRASIKLPKQGEEEFNHWDYDPWFGKLDDVSYQSILNLTERHFRCVPESNSLKWHEDFKKTYTYLASERSRPLVMIDKENDPWNLGQILPLGLPAKTQYGCIRDIVCPAGSLVIFSNRLMHSVAKNPTNKIIYGLYLSYFKAGNRDLMAVYNRKGYGETQWKALHPNANRGDTELADRIRSYKTGVSPYRFPGGGITQYVPTRTFLLVIKKRRPSTIGKHPKTGNPWIYEKPLPNYQPPALTPLGHLVLGLETYSGQTVPELQLTQEKLSYLELNGWY